MSFKRGLMVSALALGVAAPAWAQDANMSKLQSMKVTGTPMDIPQVDQGGAKAAQLRENLKAVKLPPGFSIDLYAIVPDARHMAVGPQGVVTFVGTRKNKVWAVTDRDRDDVADEVKEFAPLDRLQRSQRRRASPRTASCSSPSTTASWSSRRPSSSTRRPDVAVGEVVPQGQLIPVEEESFNHGARICRIGPDNKLYVTLGQPFNVPPKEKRDLYKEWGIGGIVRMDRDGKNREVYVDGVRNSVGMDFNPANGELWFNDNQVDGMGDDIPPGELNRVTAQGQNFGFPWYGGGTVRTVEYQDEEVPADVVRAADRADRRTRPISA